MSRLYKDYFDWLYGRVYGKRNVDPAISYTILCDSMNRLVFKDLVPHDANRIAEGTALRAEFLEQYTKQINAMDKIDLLMPDASVFEVLVGLANRADFQLDRGEPYWFQLFVSNLKLHIFTDLEFKASDSAKIERKLRRFNDRRYDEDGIGGIFPLRTPPADQRKVELWYQMAAYMTENDMY